MINNKNNNNNNNKLPDFQSQRLLNDPIVGLQQNHFLSETLVSCYTTNGNLNQSDRLGNLEQGVPYTIYGTPGITRTEGKCYLVLGISLEVVDLGVFTLYTSSQSSVKGTKHFFLERPQRIRIRPAYKSM